MGAARTGVIIHGFAKDQAYAKRCEELDIHLSLGLRTLQMPPCGFEAAVKNIPLRLIVTETDSNQPWEVVKACEMIGRIKGLETDEVGSTATKNLRRLTEK
jgi:Tat protein secretion system quality control protein TatD with DNase activity